MKITILIFASLIGLSITGIATADAPPLINYRGHFDGPPAVPDQPVSQSLVFSLFDSMIATEPLWTETQQVSIFDGNFAVLLGSVTPLSADLFIEPIRYIGVKTETGPELMRQQIISVPYAMRADAADVADVAANAENAKSADSAIQAVSATVADSAKVADTASKANQIGNLSATAEGKLGIGITNPSTPISMGSDLSDIKLAIWDNGREPWGLGIQSAQLRFNIGLPGGRFSFYDRAYATFIRSGPGRGKTDNKRENQPNGNNPEQIIIDPIGFWIDPIEIFTIQGNGLVGVGIPNPQQKLDVAGNIRASGSYLNSDIRLKKDIHTLDNSLESILRLRGVEYVWKTEEFEDRHFSEGKQIGLIAQEVEQVIPELVSTDQDDFKSVDYSRLVPVLVEAIKEQQKQIQNQQWQIESLTDEIDVLKQPR